jgi:hypothetical protein
VDEIREAEKYVFRNNKNKRIILQIAPALIFNITLDLYQYFICSIHLRKWPYDFGETMKAINISKHPQEKHLLCSTFLIIIPDSSINTWMKICKKIVVFIRSYRKEDKSQRRANRRKGRKRGLFQFHQESKRELQALIGRYNF